MTNTTSAPTIRAYRSAVVHVVAASKPGEWVTVCGKTIGPVYGSENTQQATCQECTR